MIRVCNYVIPIIITQNIVCAQSFHWFATEAALQEMTRVLVPRGRISMLLKIVLENTHTLKEPPLVHITLSTES